MKLHQSVLVSKSYNEIKFQVNTFFRQEVMDYQVKTIGKTIIPAFIDPVTFCILSNNCKMNLWEMLRLYATTVKAFKCMYHTKITYATGCAK